VGKTLRDTRKDRVESLDEWSFSGEGGRSSPGIPVKRRLHPAGEEYKVAGLMKIIIMERRVRKGQGLFLHLLLSLLLSSTVSLGVRNAKAGLKREFASSLDTRRDLNNSSPLGSTYKGEFVLVL